MKYKTLCTIFSYSKKKVMQSEFIITKNLPNPGIFAILKFEIWGKIEKSDCS